MGGAQLAEAFGTAYEADVTEMAGAFVLQLRNGAGGAPAGGEHGIDDENLRGGEVGGELEVVALRAVGPLIAVHADMADAGIREDLEHAVDEAEAGAEDGGDDDGAGEGGAGVGSERGVDGALEDFKIAGDLEGHEGGEFAELAAECLGGGGAVADDGELNPDERVIDKGDAFE